jgi:hypothetical protein
VLHRGGGLWSEYILCSLAVIVCLTASSTSTLLYSTVRQQGGRKRRVIAKTAKLAIFGERGASVFLFLLLLAEEISSLN